MRIHSLRFKLGWTHGLFISVVFVFIGIVRYQTVSYRSRAAFDEELLSGARFIASRVTFDREGFHWPTQELAVDTALRLEELMTYFVVSDAEGRVLYDRALSTHVQELLEQRRLDGVLRQTEGFATVQAMDRSQFRFVSLPVEVQGESSSCTLHVARSMAALHGVLNEYLWIYIYSVPLVLAVSAGVGWFLAGRALKPFDDVARTAERITSKNLNTRIETPHTEEEIQRLVQSFNEMVRRLNHSFQELRRFNADAAHELRTPLSILQGENEIALRSPALPEEMKAVLASNLEELARLTRIVKDLLLLAEADAGQQILERKPLRVKVLIQDLVEHIRLMGADQGIDVVLGPVPDVVVEGDELWMRRALLNLLDNALNYSRPGGVVEVNGEVRDSRVRIRIRDDGIGIDAVDLPRIFDRLYRADPARSRASGGTGLGLSIVKWVVEAHEGRVMVESEPGKGSKFEVELPELRTVPQT